MLSADSLIVLADAIRKSTRRKAEMFALSLSCVDLWNSWEGKSGNSIDVFSSRKSTKKAKEHESVLGLGRVRQVRQVMSEKVCKILLVLTLMLGVPQA